VGGLDADQRLLHEIVGGGVLVHPGGHDPAEHGDEIGDAV
jgi:hypothetical protein